VVVSQVPIFPILLLTNALKRRIIFNVVLPLLPNAGLYSRRKWCKRCRLRYCENSNVMQKLLADHGMRICNMLTKWKTKKQNIAQVISSKWRMIISIFWSWLRHMEA